MKTNVTTLQLHSTGKIHNIGRICITHVDRTLTTVFVPHHQKEIAELRQTRKEEKKS